MLTKFFLATIVFLTISCQRKSEETSSVKLQVPTYSRTGSLATCTKCLKVLVVNASGDDFQTIFQQVKHGKFEEAGTEINSEIEFLVPSGNARTLQVMAAYAENGKISLQYGKITVDLNMALPPPINLILTNLGEFRGGSIVGRYITSTGFESSSPANAPVSRDYGPTGIVGINIVEPTSGIEMEIQQGEILNGWFNFLASENFQIKYKMKDASGTLLFGQAMTLDVFALSNYASFGFTNGNSATRIHRPNDYYKDEGNMPWKRVTEYHDIVYGFFSPNPGLIVDTAVPANSRLVCVEGASTTGPMQFSRMAASSDGSTALTYFQTNTGGPTVYGNGLLNSFSDSTYCVPSSVNGTVRATDKRIFINQNQLDGRGNDTAAGISNGFTYTKNGAGLISKVNKVSSTNIMMYGLPGVLDWFPSSPFNTIRFFKKTHLPSDSYDEAECSLSWMLGNGFEDDTARFSNSRTDNFMNLTLSPGITAGESNIVYIACAAKNFQLMGNRGFYIGSLNQ